METICGISCNGCGFKSNCKGCKATNGRPFGKSCVVANCVIEKKNSSCQNCISKPCQLKETIIEEFNNLNIKDMDKITSLNELVGSFINLTFTTLDGNKFKLFDDKRIYLGNQLPKNGTNHYYGLIADEEHLLVCEYEQNGLNPKIIVYKDRNY